MRPALLLISPFLVGLLVTLGLALRPGPPARPPAAPFAENEVAAPARPASVPGPTHAAFSPEDVFRRAFWRHPTPADKVVHAERIESADASAAVGSWRWFVAVHPGPELLAALRAPDTFGLRPVESADLAINASSPAWFPVSAPTDFEILRAPTGGLTVLYRAKDNLLYATDHGAGFAPPRL